MGKEDYDFMESLRKMGLGDLAGFSAADIAKDPRRDDPKYAAAFAFLDLAKTMDRGLNEMKEEK